MSASGTVLVWICAGLAALPLSPCAFVATVCGGHEQRASVDAEPAPESSCCAQHDRRAREDAQPEREPCKGDCCRISPFVAAGEKLGPASQPATLFAVLPLLDGVHVGDIALLTSAVPQRRSLNVLHCQWRC